MLLLEVLLRFLLLLSLLLLMVESSVMRMERRKMRYRVGATTTANSPSMIRADNVLLRTSRLWEKLPVR